MAHKWNKNESRRKSHPKQEVTHEKWSEQRDLMENNYTKMKKANEASVVISETGLEVKWKTQAEMFKNTLTGAQKLGLYNGARETKSSNEKKRRKNFTSSCVWFHCLRIKKIFFAVLWVRTLTIIVTRSTLVHYLKSTTTKRLNFVSRFMHVIWFVKRQRRDLHPFTSLGRFTAQRLQAFSPSR